MSKKLYKSTTDRKLCGVCAGIANYLNIDPTVVRLLWALITFLGGAGVIAYIVCLIVSQIIMSFVLIIYLFHPLQLSRLLFLRHPWQQ